MNKQKKHADSSILEEVLSTKHNQDIREFEPTRIAFDLLDDLDSRSRDIIVKRFSLDGKGLQTLESIGSEYDITRERVRQIESAVLKKLNSSGKKGLIVPSNKIVVGILGDHGHIAEEQFLMSKVLVEERDTEQNRRSLIFLMHLSDELQLLQEDQKYRRGWAHIKANLESIQDIVERAQEILLKTNKPMTSQELAQRIIESHERDDLDYDSVISHVALSKDIHKNPFDEWGLTEWREIVPKGVKDKAYIVLKKHEEPLHFVELTDKINEAVFDKKKAYSQTVHNELIKDPRFVLVGRGTYALKDWGYEPGTVADVIEKIFKDTKRPMSRDEIVEKVLEKRFVKKNTILLALQDKDKFKRIQKDKFTFAESK